MLIGETILNRMSFMIETEWCKDPRFLDDEWAFFISFEAFKKLAKELHDDEFLQWCMFFEIRGKMNFKGHRIHVVNTLKEDDIYFGRRRKE